MLYNECLQSNSVSCNSRANNLQVVYSGDFIKHFAPSLLQVGALSASAEALRRPN